MNLLISKKGRMSKALMFFALAITVSAIALILTGESMGHGRGNSELEDTLMNGLPFVMIMGGIIAFIAACSGAKTYVNVYTDRIEGAGIGKNGIAVHNFCFTKDMHYSVQRSGANLRVTCGSESYWVRLTSADADEVYRCASGAYSYRSAPQSSYAPPKAPQSSYAPPKAPQNNPQQASAKTVRVCPNCQAKLNVPTGKGHIRITCPKCKKIFDAIS